MKGIAVRGLILVLLFTIVAILAPKLNVSDPAKPIDAAAGYAFVAVMLVAGGLWCSAWGFVRRQTEFGRPALLLILAFAMLFRAIVIFAPPILELDLYRYLWDGWVSTHGVSPFRFSPSEVMEAVRFGELEKDATLKGLAAAVERNPMATELVGLVHYPDLTTAYPATSQALFAFCATIAPKASVDSRTLVMKVALLSFEMAAWVLIAVLMQRTGRPIGWLILPSWCPLAVLSTANQGHLDAFPAFLATAALATVIVSPGIAMAGVSGALLALACGAKVYPILLAPLLATYFWRRPKGSLLPAFAVFSASLAICSVALWTPLLEAAYRSPTANGVPNSGLWAFAKHWEMNDSVFAIVSENLKPDNTKSRTPWYVITPNSWRQGIADPNAVARGVWIGATALIGFSLLVALWRSPSVEICWQSSFLLLVWFWALGPVCNPWYLLWMLPLLPFVQNRGWMLLFAFAPAMFVRFPMTAQFGESGEYWYDHGVAIGIAAVWMAALVVTSSSGLPPESSHSASPSGSLRDRG